MIDNTMTEAQARAKLWCPMARVLFRTGFVGNRIDPQYKKFAEGADREFFERQEDSCRCIASECAMWRSVNKTAYRKEGEKPDGGGWSETGETSTEVDHAAGGTVQFKEWKRTVGFCGLAGGTVQP